jgi:transcription antitermination factor NusG
LKVGTQVRIIRGPLAGVEGVLIRRKSVMKVVLSIDLIMKSLAVEVSSADLEPVQASKIA